MIVLPPMLIVPVCVCHDANREGSEVSVERRQPYQTPTVEQFTYGTIENNGAAGRRM